MNEFNAIRHLLDITNNVAQAKSFDQIDAELIESIQSNTKYNLEEIKDFTANLINSNKDIKSYIIYLCFLLNQAEILKNQNFIKKIDNIEYLCDGKLHNLKKLLTRAIPSNSKNSLIDFIQKADLPETDQWHKFDWYQLIYKEPKSLKYLRIADLLESKIGRVPRRYQVITKKIAFMNHELDNYNLSNHDQEFYKSMYISMILSACNESEIKMAFDLYEGRSNLKLKTSENLPEIIIDGKKMRKYYAEGNKNSLPEHYSEFYLRSLDYDDFRKLTLGDGCNSNYRLGGSNSDLAVESFINPDVSMVVLFEKKAKKMNPRQDKVVASSIVFKSEDNFIFYDFALKGNIYKDMLKYFLANAAVILAKKGFNTILVNKNKDLRMKFEGFVYEEVNISVAANFADVKNIKEAYIIFDKKRKIVPFLMRKQALAIIEPADSELKDSKIQQVKQSSKRQNLR